MKKGSVYLLGIVGALALVLMLSNVAVNFPTIGGHGKYVVTTEVTVQRSIISNPWIASVKNLVGAQETESVDISPQFLDWHGYIKVTVLYPGGEKKVVGTKSIDLNVFSTKTITFIWYSNFEGKHTVIVSLYDDKGRLIDQKPTYVVI